jgi:hypothetical protein
MPLTMRRPAGRLETPEESVLEYLVLRRLERFARGLADPRVRELPLWHGLARRGAAASLEDCLAAGLRDEARLILSRAGAGPAAAAGGLGGATG